MWSRKLNNLFTRTADGQLKIAILIDPDKYNKSVVELANNIPHCFFLVGGSELKKSTVHQTIKKIRMISGKPIVIFPGDEKQTSPLADGILFLSLVSGRNPEYLIGKHVISAPLIKKHNLDFIPVAYLLINGKKTSATQKVSNTKPLSNNRKIIYNTVLASCMLGMKMIYMEAGSGATRSISANLAAYIKAHFNYPLIIGGGIKSIKQIQQLDKAGVDCVVIGNYLEKNPLFLSEIKNYRSWN